MNYSPKEHIFYETHLNFVKRTVDEYKIAPGIKCKFDKILFYIGNLNFDNALDIGCSGNSILHFMPNVIKKYFCDIAHLPLSQYKKRGNMYPVCGSITHVPFKNEFFDLITALDVLEHIKDDKLAVSELHRILKINGLMIVTVPHRKKYFTNQDKICGHYRRYEHDEIVQIFSNQGIKEIISFPIYGQLMKVQFFQCIDPKGTENKLNNLREKYHSNLLFRKSWDFFVWLFSNFMKIDASIQSFKNTMDICIIFKKV